MSRGAIGIAILAVAMAVCLLPEPALAQSQTTVTGAGAGTLPAGASFNGVSLSGLRFGMGVSTASKGTASGDFESTLLGTAAGQSRTITVVGKPSSGSVAGASTATFSGLCVINMGDGTPPLTGVPFTATAVAGVGATERLTLSLGSTSLPTATGSDGRITVAK
jgi:hypothetical protein